MQDGRQSEQAWNIVRGVMRMLHEMGHASIPELVLANGQRADVMAITSTNGILIAEVKSSPADFHADAKWQNYVDWCDQFYFAIDARTLPELIPTETGLILADGYGAMIVREPQTRQPLSGARRKAVTLRFAQTAARRLHKVSDPQAGIYI